MNCNHNYLDALNAKADIEWQLFNMWGYVEEGLFKIAMYHHFRYLACKDEYTEIMNNLHFEERIKLGDVYGIADGWKNKFTMLRDE